MKVLKTARQKNFRINQEYYREDEIEAMLVNGIIDRPFIDSEKERGIGCCNYKEQYICLYASNCKEVKVVYDKDFECYDTVAITHNNMVLHVTI